jgi:cytochrome b561
MDTETAYDRRTILLHWLSALLIVALWAAGQTIDYFPRGSPRVNARSVHISLGLILAAVLAVRLAWRMRGGRRLVPALPGTAGRVARGVHHLLYLLVLLTLALGVSAVWVRGDSWFGLIQVPAFDPGNRPLREQVVDLHGLLANALLLLAAGHALMALWHQARGRHPVLVRMWPGLQTRRTR